MTLQFHLAWQS